MRTRGINVQQILLGLALLAALVWNLAHAAEVRGVRLDNGPTGTRAELQLDREAEFRLITLANPHRLVVDLPGSQLAGGAALPPAAGVVQGVRSGKPEPGTVRIVFDLAAPVAAMKPRYEAGPGGTRLVIEWPGDGPVDPIARIAATTPAPAPVATAPASPAASEEPPQSERQASAAATSRLVAQLRAAQQAASAPPVQPPASPPQPQSTNAPSLPRAMPTSSAPAAVASTSAPATSVATPPAAGTRTPSPAGGRVATAGTRPLVIAIDAGHGGQDPGAIGPAGTYEKHVVLSIARELARQINATPGMRAYLVRDKDVYVELPNRARRARQAQADMFVSIHADAAHNRSAYGSSVYTLSTRGASSQQARWLADRENASDLVGGVRLEQNTLSNVLLDLAQSGHMKASQDAARHVLQGLRDLGKAHKADVEYANFSVLRNADMPAMLVETGFISNHAEEKRLADPAHQRRLATAVLGGINAFFVSQPPPGTLYAARAAADRVAVAGGAGGGGP